MMKKAIVKRAADILEKIGVGGMILGIFKAEVKGMILGGIFLLASIILTALESKL